MVSSEKRQDVFYSPAISSLALYFVMEGFFYGAFLTHIQFEINVSYNLVLASFLYKEKQPLLSL